MRRELLSFILAALLLFIGCSEREQNAAGAEPQSSGLSKADVPLAVLPPSVAGMFYPSDAETLRADIARYLKSASPPEIDGEIVAAIVPHAGYVYSAPVAAYAYEAIARQAEKQGSEADKKLDAVVVLAFSHRGGHGGVSVYYQGAMETPLGLKGVNEEIARAFMNSDPRLSFSQRVFVGEHSGEVQIPFIQTVLPDVPIVPVIFGQQNALNVEAVARWLEEIARGNRILVIATTDLSHYSPYERANSMDTQTVRLMVEGDPRQMAGYVSEHHDRMCGPGPVLAAMSYAESRGATPVLLKYLNSGDTAGDKAAVVGYAAVVFVKKNSAEPNENKPEASAIHENEAGESDSNYLDGNDKKTLLQLARRSLESFVRNKTLLLVDAPESERLRQNGAAFVTLTKNGQLRGCIGSMQPTMPLYHTVIRMAAEAASEDPRFPPVQPEELEDIHIEISVNTPLREVSGPDEIVLGKHGVVVAKGLRQGVFLPQVAKETGWTKKEFLENLCAHKAGLPPDAYKRDAKLYVFSSIVFDEER
jgi:AmmeMemoRadiSam system protein B/AmmeMemoRadiSam system protein A